MSKETMSLVISEVHSIREGSFSRRWRAIWMARFVGTLVKRETTYIDRNQSLDVIEGL